MRTYQIELRREAYITVTVEANDQDGAEALAWKQIQNDYYKDDGAWQIDSIEEIES